MRRIALLCVIVAGCLQPDLVECGDLACPTGTMCIAGECSVDRCGDGVLDPGETCDCGSSSASLAQGCATPNSDAVTAQCDLSCTRRCGDGAVTGSEQCDGPTVPVTCTQLGYYEGSPSCTAGCALDQATCAGRCGDHVVQADHEDCDGSPPASGTCLTYGRDYGALRCGASCSPDLAGSCATFGWRTVFPASSTIRTLAANRRGAIAIETPSGDILVTWDGVVTRRPNPGWTTVVASGPHLIALGSLSYSWFDGTWHDAPVSLTLPVAAATTSTGLVYLVRPDCAVTRLAYATGTLATIAGPAATVCATPVTVLDELYVAAGAAGILRWNGIGWTTVLAGPIESITRGVASHLIAADASFHDVDVSLAQATSVPVTQLHPPTQLESDIDGTLIGLGIDSTVDVVLGRVLGTRTPSASSALVRTEDGTVVAYGLGAYRVEPELVVPAPLGSGTSLRDLEALPDGALAYCGSAIGWLDSTAGDGTRPWSGGSCDAILGDPRGSHVVRAAGRVYQWNGGTGAYVDEQVPGFVTGIAGTAALPFAHSASTIYARLGPTWTSVSLPSGCAPSAVVGFPGATFALGACDPSTDVYIFQFDGSSFVEVARTTTPIDAARVLGDGTLVVASASSTRLLVGGAFVDAPVSGMAYGATANDYFIVSAGGSVFHVHGASVAEIRLPVGSGLFEVTAQALWSWDPIAQRIVGVPRTTVRLPGSGL